jgi:hypothetical protein
MIDEKPLPVPESHCPDVARLSLYPRVGRGVLFMRSEKDGRISHV